MLDGASMKTKVEIEQSRIKRKARMETAIATFVLIWFLFGLFIYEVVKG